MYICISCREELGKNINADEAAAMGAVYQAAALSKAFKVKPFLVRDAAVFPIQVSAAPSPVILNKITIGIMSALLIDELFWSATNTQVWT